MPKKILNKLKRFFKPDKRFVEGAAIGIFTAGVVLLSTALLQTQGAQAEYAFKNVFSNVRRGVENTVQRVLPTTQRSIPAEFAQF